MTAPDAARDLSVIVPTRNRRESLLRLLRSLRTQTLSADTFEVVLVDDGSTDGTSEAVQRLETEFPIRIVRGEGRGAAPARADGAEAAHGALLLFLDDDLSMDPGALAAHWNAHPRAPGETDLTPRAVIGPYYPIHTPTRDPFRILTRNWWEDTFADMARPGHRASYRDVLSGNLSLPRETFFAVGGFDRRFVRMRCEDWELGVRLVKHRIPIVCCPEAHAEHFENETTSLVRALGDAGREGRGFAILDRLHPELAAERSLDGPLGDGQTKRLVHALARRGGRPAEVLLGAVRHVLPPLAWVRWRRTWGHIYGMLHLYFFWRGYLEPLDDAIRPADENEGDSATVEDVELGAGLAAAEHLLDRTRPDAARILWHGVPIAAIDPRPGSERLRGVHLRDSLERDLAAPLRKALLGS